MSASTTHHKNHNTLNDKSTRQSTNYSISKIESADSVRWLRKGIEDFKVSNINSLLYGLMFVIAGAITIWYTRDNPVLVMAIVTGFYLVGPPLASGLYDMSRAIEKGQTPSLLHAISVFGRNFVHLIGLSLILGAIMLVWTAVSSLLVGTFFGETVGITGLVAGEQATEFLGVLLIAGIVLAMLASTISISFLPLLNNRKMGTITMLVILALIMLAWVRTMIMAINAFLNNTTTIESGWNAMTGDPMFMSFLVVFLLVGLFFATIAFTISVISVPMIIHRRVGVLTAISTSVKAVKQNPLPMLRWAATIAVLITVGMSFFFIGLALALPVIGHASWHAYREIITDDA